MAETPPGQGLASVGWTREMRVAGDDDSCCRRAANKAAHRPECVLSEASREAHADIGEGGLGGLAMYQFKAVEQSSRQGGPK